ncbi:MAG: hypothetical protein EBT13_12835 [Rhodobacteraceae bacterium]|nr:hypothetical protein [Paracoccaceae bacterium]
MLKIISDLRPRVVCLENVPGIFTLGIGTVLGGLAEIGYNSEWQIIQASDFGAPHQRKRWFAIAYPSSIGPNKTRNRRPNEIYFEKGQIFKRGQKKQAAYSNRSGGKLQSLQPFRVEKKSRSKLQSNVSNELHKGGGYFSGFPSVSPVCRRDDGVSNRVDRIRALGNAIVPQCSEYIGKLILESGLLNNFEREVT